jgi:proline dehydrogenase
MKTSRRLLLKLLMLAPPSLVWRFARVYIAGETIDDAVRVIRKLNSQGCRATVDVLGEDVTDEREVGLFVEAYRQAIEVIVREKLDANVSIKPTAMGLKIAPEVARRATTEVLRTAGKNGMSARMDMEDSSTTQTTLDLYDQLRADGFGNVGVVLQSYLRRTLGDAARLGEMGASVRLCKGIYIEPRRLAYQDRETVRAAFVTALETLLVAPRSFTAIATHDEWLTVMAEGLIQKHRVGRERYEFQMLLGVDPLLRGRLVGLGHPLRVYVPFGKGWRGYSMRRLMENPRFAGHVARNVLSPGRTRDDAVAADH